jgi:hypothetical protein
MDGALAPDCPAKYSFKLNVIRDMSIFSSKRLTEKAEIIILVPNLKYQVNCPFFSHQLKLFGRMVGAYNSI